MADAAASSSSSDKGAEARARGRGGGGGGSYQRQMKGDRSSRGARTKRGGILQSAGRARARESGERFDKEWGFSHLEDGEEHVGYLVNMMASTVAAEDRTERSGIDLYFLKQDGGTFKSTLLHEPYFYVACRREWARIVSSLLTRKFEGVLSGIDHVEMEDLDLPNHLTGIRAPYMRLRFRSIGELMDVRNEVRSAVQRNRTREAGEAAFEEADVRLLGWRRGSCRGFARPGVVPSQCSLPPPLPRSRHHGAPSPALLAIIPSYGSVRL